MIINNMPQNGGEVLISQICAEWSVNSAYGSNEMYLTFKHDAANKQFALRYPADSIEYNFIPPVSVVDLISGGISIRCTGQETYNELNGTSLSITPNTEVAGTYALIISVINPRDPR